VSPVELLRAAVDKAGTQTAFAKKHGISIAYVNDVLQGRRQPGDKILKALGLESQVTYRKAAK
jgi:transcriptional regulator with XRE-family HTH domain